MSNRLLDPRSKSYQGYAHSNAWNRLKVTNNFRGYQKIPQGLLPPTASNVTERNPTTTATPANDEMTTIDHGPPSDLLDLSTFPLTTPPKGKRKQQSKNREDTPEKPEEKRADRKATPAKSSANSKISAPLHTKRCCNCNRTSKCSAARWCECRRANRECSNC